MRPGRRMGEGEEVWGLMGLGGTLGVYGGREGWGPRGAGLGSKGEQGWGVVGSEEEGWSLREVGLGSKRGRFGVFGV